MTLTRLLALLFSRDIAIDLGNTNICVFERGRGIVLHEPAVAAIHRDGQGRRKVVATGRQAKRMLGRTPDGVEVIRPMIDGVISHFEVIQILLQSCIRAVYGRSLLTSPRLMICAPVGSTPVELKAIRDAAREVGAREVFILDEPLAGAIGAGLPILEPKPSMIVDMGGGTTEASVISLGGIVVFESIRTAGDELDEAIQQYVRRRYNLNIGLQEAEAAKMAVGSAVPGDLDARTRVRGLDMGTGLPTVVEISSEEISRAIARPIEVILGAVLRVLERCPPELAAGLIDAGVVLSGGGSLLHGMARLLGERTGLPVVVAEDPLTTVARGLDRCLEHLPRYRDLLK